MTPRILLIEDDQWLAESYNDILEAYEVDIAANANDAMDLIDSNDYDLVIADVMLDYGVVIDLLHEMQAYDDTAQIPVILCTSLAANISENDVKSYGVAAVLDKTMLTSKILRETVEENIRE